MNSFTAKTVDLCVKCSKDILPGQDIGWLRDANRKGYFHLPCAPLPTIESLALVRVQDQTVREGFRYVRVKDLTTPALLPEHPVAKRRAVPKVQPPVLTDEQWKVLREPLPGPWEVKKPNEDGILVNKTTLTQMIAAAVAQLPRIVVNITVAQEQDAEAALEMLSKELFVRKGVQTI
jgi:hypothetical protein